MVLQGNEETKAKSRVAAGVVTADWIEISMVLRFHNYSAGYHVLRGELLSSF